jgi:hypothetical protein
MTPRLRYLLLACFLLGLAAGLLLWIVILSH